MSPTKKKTRGEKSISLMALEFLYEQGPMTHVALTELVREQPKCAKYTSKSVYGKLLEIEKRGLVTRDDKGVWYLCEGVTPQTLSTGELEMNTERATVAEQEPEEEVPEEEGEVEEEPAPAAQEKPRRPNTQAGAGTQVVTGKDKVVPLDQRDQFIRRMQQIGVSPKEAIPTIADIFFAGDIDDLEWLETVLKRHAAGYVTAYQRNLILGFWAKTRGLPYSEDEKDWALPEKGSKAGAKKEAAKGGEKKPSTFDPGQGWRVAKDKDGDWVPFPGGPLDYEEALDRSERRAALAAYGVGGGEEGESAGGEAEQPEKKGKGKAPALGILDQLLVRVLENALDGGGKKDSAAEAKIEQLQGELARMKDDQNEARMERMEGMIAQALSRDPWDEFNRFQSQAQRFGYAPNVVTDSSPAVQLIKDSSDKIDKTAGRFMGLLERMVLRSEEFEPEKTRTPKERDEKAGELLHTAQGREHSKALRREVFG